MKHEHFIACSCSTEGIYIVKHEDEDEVYISFFSHGLNPKRMTLWNKIRYIWRVLKGKPFEDQLVLNKSDALRLSSLLNTLYK